MQILVGFVSRLGDQTLVVFQILFVLSEMDGFVDNRNSFAVGRWITGSEKDWFVPGGFKSVNEVINDLFGAVVLLGRHRKVRGTTIAMRICLLTLLG